MNESFDHPSIDRAHPLALRRGWAWPVFLLWIAALASCQDPVTEQPQEDPNLQALHSPSQASPEDPVQPEESDGSEQEPQRTGQDLATLQRQGREVTVSADAAQAVLTWVRDQLKGNPMRLRRRMLTEDWEAVLKEGHWLRLQLPAGAAEPWGSAAEALLPLAPHDWAGWLLLRQGGDIRSPYVVGAIPEGMLP